jgi:hypothetical protein
MSRGRVYSRVRERQNVNRLCLAKSLGTDTDEVVYEVRSGTRSHITFQGVRLNAVDIICIRKFNGKLEGFRILGAK